MKIKKYQAGGIYYTPFFGDSVQESTPQTTSKKEDKEDQLIEKEIISVLKENGLPSDVDYFLSVTNNFLKKSQNLGSLFGDSTSKNSYNMSDLIRIQSLANKIKHNNELYKTASSQIVKENAGSEIAITNTGQVYVYDQEDGIKTISVNDYYDNSDKYNLLTNSELIHLRESQPELAYNSSILLDLSNTVGMKSIIDYVKATIGAFGTNKSNSQIDRYTVKQKEQIEQGFEELLGFGSPDGIYKVTDTLNKSDQGVNMQLAVNYLYKTLPNNMKHVLRVNAAAEGLDPNDSKDVQQLLQMAVMEHTNHSVEQKREIDYDSTASKNIGFGTEGSSGKDKEMSYLEMLAVGRVTKPVETIINSSNGTTGLKILAQPYGYPLDDSEHQIGRSTLRDAMNMGQFGKIVNKNSVTYGDKILSDSDLDKIVYDGTSNLNRAYLPINEYIKATTGKIVPDLDAAERFDKFLEWYDAGYGITPNSIIMKAQDLNLDIYQDQKTGDWKLKNTHPFLIVNGYTSDKAVDLDENSKWIEHVDDSEGEELFEMFSKILNFGSETPSKSKRRNDFSGGIFGWGNSDSMYKSAIFMPITDTAIASVVSNHEIIDKENYRDILNKRQLKEETQTIKTNFN